MDLMHLFSSWLTFYTIAFLLTPILQVKEWLRRGSADGFSALALVIAFFTGCLWLRYNLLIGDIYNIIVNAVAIVLMSGYVAIYAYMHPKPSIVAMQYMAALSIATGLFMFVATLDESYAPTTMGSLATIFKLLSMTGGVYEIKRTMALGTSEYLPLSWQLSLFTVYIQWVVYGLIKGNFFFIVTNAASFALSSATLSLYFFYPPVTWRVPVIGTQQTGPEAKKLLVESKKKD